LFFLVREGSRVEMVGGKEEEEEEEVESLRLS